MLEGRATSSGTSAYSDRHPSIDFRFLGTTGWQVSPAGFGGYRVSDKIPVHRSAMTQALCQGINLIDTSSNYTDGASERLVGEVLNSASRDLGIRREQVVVVSKLGYLQGRNYALSQRRKQEGRPFPDLVPYGDGLEHCIHPEFLADQLSRSLERLQLETIDVVLLHNPEYYLGWAASQGLDPDEAHDEFYGRIAAALDYLESQANAGRIQAYGISANTFPVAATDDSFVSLEKVWQIARKISAHHHFQVIQLPVNLFESGAMLERNQSRSRSVLNFANEKGLGVLVNRPLNAFANHRLLRLAEVETIGHHSDTEIIKAIGALTKSEKVLWRKVLIDLDLPSPLYQRVKDQAGIGDQLKHYWRNFGSYARWRQFTDGFLWPHLAGVFDFLEPYAAQSDAVAQWLANHPKRLNAAVRAVGSLYVGEAVAKVQMIKEMIRNADPHWDIDGTLSQLAIRTLRSTLGVTTVLVGMRQALYVDDVLQELKRKARVELRDTAWRHLAGSLSDSNITE